MSRKPKYPVEEKEKIVKKYMSGKHGLKETLQMYTIDESTLKRWTTLYKESGTQGLMPRKSNTRYTSELKQKVVDEYLDGKGSYREIAFKYHISNNSVVMKWVKDYNGHGTIKQTPDSGGRTMTNGRKTEYNERVEIVSYCIENGHDYGKTVEKYNVSYQQIYSWVKKYETKGTEGLTDKRGVRKDEASMTELEKLKAKNRLLEARNRELEMENDVLKKFEEVKRGNR